MVSLLLEAPDGVVGVDVAAERQVGGERLQAEVGVPQREHHLLEQQPVAGGREGFAHGNYVSQL
ncbi:hypothetical protein TRIUR3_28970 [Triticum urartu]|uniref:Uncharacterized protein n=1 Tax=Triticum urartu TaxID=4572 RepID=M7ZV76_TRIUA|nr:hypothetical protein TRIUR3_28970 [Triticum urartu]